MFYPLEILRTRLQIDCNSTRGGGSSLRILYRIATDKNDGISSLYRGWSSLVMALVCLNFVYFYCFRSLRRLLERYAVDYWFDDAVEYKVFIDLFAGYVAGVIGVLVTGPLWLVNTRLKLQGGNNLKSATKNNSATSKKYHGIIHCIYTISKEEGISTLWNGTTTSIILSLNPAIQLGVYELLKRHHTILSLASGILSSIMIPSNARDDAVAEKERESNAFEPFVNAILAKFISTIVTYPIQVLQTQHRAGMVSPSNSKVEYGGWIQDMKYIVKQHGVGGLYRGLESKLLQTLLNSGFMFLIYEHLFEFLRKLLGSSDQ